MNAKTLIRNIFPQTLRLKIFTLIQFYRHRPSFQKKQILLWETSSKKDNPAPPHIIKSNTVKKYALEYKLENLVETGTYKGEMIFETKLIFKRIISIELSPQLHKYVKHRFDKYKNIQLICGDSSLVLKDLALQHIIDEPTLFWLDAHYSAGDTAKSKKETPIIEELNIILKTNSNHIILIDDAHFFVGKNDYPTIEKLKELIRDSLYKMKIENNIIHIFY